jgi:hypothetical protein
MITGEKRGRWARMLRYTLGGALGVATVVAALTGVRWYLCLIGCCVAFIVILGRRTIFRPGVNRSGDEIVCRYVPWYEGNAYVLNVLVPALGVASLGAGYAPGNPVWLRFTGILLLVLTPIFAFSAVRMWRRCVLSISPPALTVRLAGPKDELIEIRRDSVLSIAPKTVPNGVSGQSLQVGITFHTADLSSDSTTVVLGLQLSVPPVDLLNALVAWKDGARDDPSELLDRIEGILRGRSTAGV